MKPATTLIIGASILATTAVARPTGWKHPNTGISEYDSKYDMYRDMMMKDPFVWPKPAEYPSKQDKQPKQDINRTSASGKKNEDAGKKKDNSKKKGDDSTKKKDDSTKKGDDSKKSADSGKDKADTGKRGINAVRADEFAVNQRMEETAKNRVDTGKRDINAGQADEFGVDQRMEESAKDRIIDWAHVE